MLGVSTQRRFIYNIASFLMAIVFGVTAGLLIPVFSGWSIYRWIFVFFVLFIMPVLFLSIGNVTRTLLFSLVFAIPLDFGLAPFGKAPYHAGGAQAVVVFILYDFPLIGLVAFWLLETLALRKPIRKSNILLAAILWITWSIISVYNSTNQRLSWFEIIRMAKLCLLMMVVSNTVRDKTDILAVIYALFLGLILQSVICTIQYTTGYNFNLGLFTVGELNRVSGTIGWPNTLGAYAASISSIAFVLFINKSSEKLRKVSLITGVAGLFTLIMSFSRGAWVAFFIALILGIFISYFRKLISFKDISRFALICLVLGISVTPFMSGIAIRFAQTNLQQSAITGRFLLNQIAYNMIETHPILGVGINTFVEVERIYDTTGISFSISYPVHNVYLLIAAETGIVGLGLFIVFIVTIFNVALQTTKSSDHCVSLSAICLMSGLTAILVSNVADDHLRTDVLFSLFWLLAGLGIAFSGMAPSSQIITGNFDSVDASS